MKDVVRIGCGAGFWGDSAEGPKQLVESGEIDYRVLEPGTVRSGDELKLLDRHPESLSLREFHVLAHAHRPTVAELMRLAHLAGLEPSWAERFRARALWLHHNAPADGARTNET